MVEAMNLMGYDAMALGALELQLSVAELRTVIEQAQFKVLSANTVVVDTNELFADPYTVVVVGGHRIGLLGLTGTDARNPALFAKDPLIAAEQYVPQLSKEADLIIVLSNAGIGVNQQIAAQVPGIDVIVSGGGAKTFQAQPQVIDLGKIKTLQVHAGYEGGWLGVLRLQLDSDHTITDHVGELWKLVRTYADDPEMVTLVNRYKAQFGSPPTSTPTKAPSATRPAPPFTPVATPGTGGYPSPSSGP